MISPARTGLVGVAATSALTLLVVGLPAPALAAPAGTAPATKGAFALPASAPGTPAPDAPSAPSGGYADLLQQAEQSGQEVEVPGLREELATTFATPEGTFRSEVTNFPQNFQADGQED